MRNHGDRSAAQPDGTMKEVVTRSDGSHRSPSGADNEPWSMGETVERIFTKYIKIREQLRPYTRELFADAHENGQPLIRGLFYEFSKDLNTADISDEYMFGPDLLVAPVTEFSARKRTVYLPGEASTIWTNLLDGTETTGGQSIVVHAPLESIPVFARNGNDHDLLGKL